jgi:hypothetical protein
LERISAPVAQLVEQLTLNQLVRGSSPCGCTKCGIILRVFPLPDDRAAAENGVDARF